MLQDVIKYEQFLGVENTDQRRKIQSTLDKVIARRKRGERRLEKILSTRNLKTTFREIIKESEFYSKYAERIIFDVNKEKINYEVNTECLFLLQVGIMKNYKNHILFTPTYVAFYETTLMRGTVTKVPVQNIVDIVLKENTIHISFNTGDAKREYPIISTKGMKPYFDEIMEDVIAALVKRLECGKGMKMTSGLQEEKDLKNTDKSGFFSSLFS